MMLPFTYTGGQLATNAYLIPNAQDSAYLCIDAPEGLAAAIRDHHLKIDALLLTHGHFDHVWDAAAIAREHGCPVYIHAGDVPLLRRSESRFAQLEAFVDLPVPANGSLLWEAGGRRFTLFHVPGHSAGSVAFHEPAEDRLFGGDLIFAGGIGRTNTPEAREELLLGISRHLLPLPETTGIYPGHGPSTTLAAEKDNPYFQTAVPA